MLKTHFRRTTPLMRVLERWRARKGRPRRHEVCNLHVPGLFVRYSTPTVTEQVHVGAAKLEKTMEFLPDYS